MNLNKKQNDDRHRRIFTRSEARITGVLYLIYFLTTISAEIMKGSRFDKYSNGVNLIAFAFYIAVTILFFYMFKPVNGLISAIAALCSLSGCVIGAISLFYLPLLQINPLLFFAPYCLLIGYLIYKSAFLPRVLGVLMMLAGLGWVVFLSPLGKYISIYLEVLGVLAEGSFMLWLLARGISVGQFKERQKPTA
jgi:tryptophan-rich sensory protein